MLEACIHQEMAPNNLLANQHDYSKGKSVGTALHDILKMIERDLALKEYNVGHISAYWGAFKNIIPAIVTSELREIGRRS